MIRISPKIVRKCFLIISGGSNEVTVICFMSYSFSVRRSSALIVFFHRLTDILHLRVGLFHTTLLTPGCGATFLRQFLSTHWRYSLILTESINGQHHVFVLTKNRRCCNQCSLLHLTGYKFYCYILRYLVYQLYPHRNFDRAPAVS